MPSRLMLVGSDNDLKVDRSLPVLFGVDSLGFAPADEVSARGDEQNYSNWISKTKAS